jgi:signal peptidase I
MKTFIRDTMMIIMIAGVTIVGLKFTAQRFVIDGPSMATSFRDGEQLVVNKLVYEFHKPERGDVIVFRPPDNPRDEYIKRIIGLPGESVEVRDGVVFIHNGDGSAFPLDEPYVSAPAERDFKGDMIPENNYFVLGDNRNNSSDSRGDWTVPSQTIVGKAWLSVWPPAEWGLVFDYYADG